MSFVAHRCGTSRPLCHGHRVPSLWSPSRRLGVFVVDSDDGQVFSTESNAHRPFDHPDCSTTDILTTWTRPGGHGAETHTRCAQGGSILPIGDENDDRTTAIHPKTMELKQMSLCHFTHDRRQIQSPLTIERPFLR